MFVNEEYNVGILADLGDTLICATHMQDLIPVFLKAIKNTVEYTQLATSSSGPIPSYAQEDDEAKWWESIECHSLMLDLFDVLDKYAPAGYYFGAHPGDSSDYGYWKLEEEG